MTPLTPEMIERAARAVEPYVFSDEYASYWPDRAKRNREEVRRRVRIVIEAALGEGVTGWKLVPVEPTPEMVAAAFPVLSNDDGVLHEDKVIGAGAVMLLEGGSDLGQITGPAVETAALLCRDYRAMLAASPAPAVVDNAGWRPIASAPKDGTRILAWHQNDWSRDPRWRVIYWIGAEGMAYRNTWLCDVCTLSILERNILCWQPLPSAPSQDAPPPRSLSKKD